MTGFDLTGLGRWTDEREFKVAAARIAAYAAATNDSDPRHLAGDVAPPVFAVVPVWEAMMGAVTDVTPPGAINQVVHSEQDIRPRRPMVPGDVIRSRAAVTGVTVRGLGTTLVARSESRDEAGAIVNQQWFTMFFRSVSEGDSGGDSPPDHKLTAAVKAGGVVAELGYPVDPDQTYRYADASGDRLAIHLDDELARSVGLPGIIVHGLCTLAFAARAVIAHACPRQSERLRRLAVKFSRPVLPGETVTTRLYDAGPSDDGSSDASLAAFGFEVVNPAGQAVVKDGRAEVAN